ncbi:hypothetical protein C8Q80DRAFT_129284 [Daedaleopsis nitida]|nr:hypothetical protein C8Q80DRAFT_129284 [Daedaleopsis nitida]
MTLPPDPQRCIPAPPVVAQYLYFNGSRDKPSLQSQMGLESDRERLDEMTAATRRAAEEHFDLRPLHYREQQPDVLQAVKEQVVRTCTDLDDYEDGWPVSRYISIYLKNYHPKKRTSQPARKSTAQGQAKNKPRPQAQSQLRGRGKEPGSRPIRPGPGRNSVGFVPRDDSSGPRYDYHIHSMSPLTKLDESSREASPEVAPDIRVLYTGKDRTVDDFLASLRIPASDASHIEMLFDKMGIRNRDYLELFAMMETRDMWLNELQRGEEVTEIQMRLLQEGLDRLKLECVETLT